MKKTLKKGFTIVELVIVIAVVAILAAVLIPTFVSVTRKANQSADIQACRQMNTYLAVNEVTADRTITEVYNALEEGGMSAKNYKPLSSDTYYFWDSNLNRILYTDKDYNVTFPEEYKNVKKTDHQWYSLTAEIKGEKTYSKNDTDGTTNITVKSGPELYQAVKDLPTSSKEVKLSDKNDISTKFKNSINNDTVITLTEDVDLMGGEFSFGAVMEGTKLMIDGKGHKISGISNLTSGVDKAALNSEGMERNYYSGIIKYVDKGATVTIKNITFENVVGGKTDVGSAGIIIGNAKIGDKESTTIVFESVKVKNATLYGKNKLGALIGAQYSGGCNVEIKGDTCLENVKIISTEGESGILFGSTDNGGGLNQKIKIAKTLIDNEQDFIKNCSVVCVSDKVEDIILTDAEKATYNMTLDGKKVLKSDTEVNEYRLTTAYFGFAGVKAKADHYPGMKGDYYFNPINTVEQVKAAGWVYDFDNNAVVNA